MPTTNIHNTMKAETLRRVNRTLVTEQARLNMAIATKAADDPLFRAYGHIEAAIDLICDYLNPE